MKPESRFIARVNNKLSLGDGPDEIYFLKLNLPYARGVADAWYSGRGGDLWVEYKWLPRVPRSLCLTSGKKPKLSRLQREWLIHRANQGCEVRVAVGTPSGVLLFEAHEVDNVITREMFLARCIREKDIAEWIEQRTTGRLVQPSSPMPTLTSTLACARSSASRRLTWRSSASSGRKQPIVRRS